MDPITSQQRQMSCPKCKKVVQSHNNATICSCCMKIFHKKCTPVTKLNQRHWTTWICKYYSDLFPFSHMEDSELCTHLNNFNSTMYNYEDCNLIFNPFMLDTEKETSFTDSWDPDLNFYSNILDSNMDTPCEYESENSFNTLCTKQGHDTHAFSTLHLNIRSLPQNHDNLIHYLSTLNHEFSIIGLSETWLNQSTSQLYDFPNDTLVHCCRSNRVGGGVSLLIRENIEFIQRDDLTIHTHEENVESLFMELPAFSSPTVKNLILGCVYRLPDTDIKDFTSHLATTLDAINKEGKTCLLLFDFDIDLLKNESYTNC